MTEIFDWRQDEYDMTCRNMTCQEIEDYVRKLEKQLNFYKPVLLRLDHNYVMC